MATKKTTVDNEPLDLSVNLKDERYPINITIDAVDKFTLYFNPADPFIYGYLTDMVNVETPDMTGIESLIDMNERMTPFVNALEKNFDAIFGDGTTRRVFKYSGANMNIIKAITEKIYAGLDDFNKQTEKVQAELREEEAKAAKLEADSFIAGK